MTRTLFAIAAAVVLPGCPGDDSCGPGAAAGDGLTLTGTGVSVRYHMATAGANNDCPAPDAPTGVVSLTISAVQVGGGSAINLCVPRPDLLGAAMALVNPQVSPAVHGAAAEVVDVNAGAAGCTLARNQATAPAGTILADGICDDGTDPAGFALVVAGQVSVDRDCSGTIDTLRLDLAGTISIATP